MNLKIKETLAKILGVLNGAVVVKTYTRTNVTSSTYYTNQTFDITKSGYTPIAASVGLNQVKAVYNSRIQGNTLWVGLGNPQQTGALSAITITANVTYIRDDLIGGG